MSRGGMAAGRAIAIIALLTGSVVAVFGFAAWEDAREELDSRGGHIARLTARASRMFYRQFEAKLVDLAGDVRDRGPQLSAAEATQLLRRATAELPGLRSLCLVDRAGRVVAEVTPPGLSQPGRIVGDTVRAAGSAVEIGRPAREQPGGQWIVPLRMVLPEAPDRPGFTLFATASVDDQWRLFSDMVLPPGWIVGLRRDDGSLQARWPLPENAERVFERRLFGPVARMLADTPGIQSGSVIGDSPVDGERRLFVFHRVPDHPLLLLFVSIPRADLWHAWLERVRLPFTLFLLLAAGGLWVHQRLAAQQGELTAETETRRSRLELLHRLAAAVIDGRDGDGIVTRALEALAQRYPRSRAAFALLGDDGRLVVSDCVGSQAFANIAGSVLDASEAHGYLEALRGGRAVAAVRAEADPRTRAILVAPDTGLAGSVLHVPVPHPDGLTGVLMLEAPAPHAWSADEFETLEGVSDQLAMALRNTHAEALRAAAETGLRDRELRYRQLAEVSSDWFWETDAAHRLRWNPQDQWHPRLARLGLTRYDGVAVWDVPSNRFEPAALARHRELLARREPFRDFEFEHTGPDGAVHHVAVSGTPVFAADGAFTGYRGLGRDITERKRAEMLLRRSEQRLRDVSELSSDWFWEQDRELRFTEVTAALTDVRVDWRLSAIGRTRWELDTVLDRDDPKWDAHRRLLAARQPFRDFVYRYIARTGERWASISGKPVFDERGEFQGYRGSGQDITERMVAEERIRYLARHDALTGLPNRAAFQQLLQQALERVRRHDRQLALMFIDLDRFKLINDTLGHGAGDRVLREVAGRLRECLRATDVVARQGGDEFVVLVEEFDSPTDLEGIGRKLLDACAHPVLIEDREYALSASLGVGTFPDDGVDTDALLRAADVAMYRAKESGRSQMQFYSPHLDTHTVERLALDSALNRAIERGELRLHFQPKLEISTGAIVGAEALVRWQHPQLGLLMPARFIPLAEESGLIVPIGAWVLDEACRQLRAWHDAGLADLTVAVNLSARQFGRDELRLDVEGALARSGLRPDHLELEITESTVMGNPGHAAALLANLDALGVGIAIDDFGTGYSSLAYLKRFPVGTLKIDRSFVQGLPDNAEDVAITQAVLALARSLKVRVVAEGVELGRQFVFLAAHGCDVAQGFSISRPLGPDMFAQFVRAMEERRRQAT